MSFITRKLVFWVCTAKEDGQRLEILDLGRSDHYYVCSVLAYAKIRFSHDAVHFGKWQLPLFCTWTQSDFNLWCKTIVSEVTIVLHYDNTPMQYTVIFHRCENDSFQIKKYNF